MAPLDGIRVLDFTQAMAGPDCSMLLADFGADVVKVEPPGGDGSRTWGSSRFGPDGQFSALYLAFNRNKASVELDLKSDAGQATARDLIAASDVVIEGFRPGVADRLGIGYDQVAAIRPDVVYCSISGFGQTGPLRERPGYDQLLQAYAGHMSITGEAERPSVRIGPSAIDLLTGAHAAFGILVALRERDRSGEGQLTRDVALRLLPPPREPLHRRLHRLAGAAAEDRRELPVPGAVRHVRGERPRVLHGRRHGSHVRAPLPGARTRGPARRPALCHERPACPPPRRARRRARADLPHTRSPDWVGLCLELDIPTSEVCTVAEVATQAQALAREMVVETGVGSVRTAGIPVKLSRTPGTIRRPAPTLGEDDASVVSRRGLEPRQA